MVAARSNPWPLASTLSGLALVTLIGCTALLFSELRPDPVPAPKKFEKYVAGDKSFACVYPEGWKKGGRDAQAIISTATFRKNGAAINVESDATGSFIADGAPAPGGNVDDMLKSMGSVPGMSAVTADMKKQIKPPVERLHEMGAEELELKLALYGCGKIQEQPAKKLQSQVGDARLSEFTGEGGAFVGKIRGYRATMLGSQRAITVICHCPESDWKALGTAFQRVIKSVVGGNT